MVGKSVVQMLSFMAMESPESEPDAAADALEGLRRLGPAMKAFKWRSAPWARGDCMQSGLSSSFSFAFFLDGSEHDEKLVSRSSRHAEIQIKKV